MDAVEIVWAVVGLVSSLGVLTAGAGFMVRAMGAGTATAITTMQKTYVSMLEALSAQNQTQQLQINANVSQITGLQAAVDDCMAKHSECHEKYQQLEARVGKVENGK